MRTFAGFGHYVALLRSRQRPSTRWTCDAPYRCATLWERRDTAVPGAARPRRAARIRRRAIGSAGERLVHTEEVTGSIPVSPTRSEAMWVSIKLTVGAIPVAVKCAAVSPRSWTYPSARKAVRRSRSHSGNPLP